MPEPQIASPALGRFQPRAECVRSSHSLLPIGATWTGLDRSRPAPHAARSPARETEVRGPVRPVEEPGERRLHAFYSRQCRKPRLKKTDKLGDANIVSSFRSPCECM